MPLLAVHLSATHRRHAIASLASHRSTYSFSKNSHAEQEMYTPPGIPRSRSFKRFTMRVGLEHFGQSVLLLVSIIFLRSPVLAIFAIMLTSPVADLLSFARATLNPACPLQGRNRTSHHFPGDETREKNRGEILDLVYTIRANQRDCRAR